MLNWQILKSPLNWLTVIFMLIIAGMAGHLLMSWAGLEPAAHNVNGN